MNDQVNRKGLLNAYYKYLGESGKSPDQDIVDLISYAAPVNVPREDADLDAVRDGISKLAAYDQLAEEAAELASAASKMVRILDGTNPTPVTLEGAIEAIREEFADVIVAGCVCGLREREVDDIITQKAKRWRGRVENRLAREETSKQTADTAFRRAPEVMASGMAASVRYSPDKDTISDTLKSLESKDRGEG